MSRYGKAHKERRAALLESYVPGFTRCARGGEILFETDLSRLHADHRDDGTGYLGLSCEHHNEQGGPVRKVPWRPTRNW